MICRPPQPKCPHKLAVGGVVVFVVTVGSSKSIGGELHGNFLEARGGPTSTTGRQAGRGAAVFLAGHAQAAFAGRAEVVHRVWKFWKCGVWTGPIAVVKVGRV